MVKTQVIRRQLEKLRKYGIILKCKQFEGRYKIISFLLFVSRDLCEH